MHTCDTHQHCIDDAMATAEALCSKSGQRFTTLRRKVLELIWQSHRPVKAYDILDNIGDVASAKPPTVYRALDFLLENRLIHKLNSLNAYVGCSHPEAHHECYFLVCSSCGDIEECCDAKLARTIAATAKKNHFHPAHTTLEISGECQECTKNN